MSELVDKDAFLKQERKWYCENCDMRKGVKNGRKCFVYEIGEAPCRACYVDDVLDDLEDFPTASPWHRVEEELPNSNDAVNVVWVNRNPESYYADIKDKPFVATAHYHNGKWYWFSATCKDYLDEYGRCEVDEVDEDIDILYWMPLPSSPVNKMFTK